MLKSKGYLFDLDGTLLDTSAIAGLRTARDWKGCVANMQRTSIFPGVKEMLEAIVKQGAAIAVVTTSVSFYANAALKHHDLPYDKLVAYHDARPKPAPDSFLKAVADLRLRASECVGIGDDIPDLSALRAAGITSLGAGWNASLYRPLEWDAVAATPMQVLNF